MIHPSLRNSKKSSSKVSTRTRVMNELWRAGIFVTNVKACSSSKNKELCDFLNISVRSYGTPASVNVDGKTLYIKPYYYIEYKRYTEGVLTNIITKMLIDEEDYKFYIPVVNLKGTEESIKSTDIRFYCRFN